MAVATSYKRDLFKRSKGVISLVIKLQRILSLNMALNQMLAGSGDDFMAAAKIAKTTGKLDKSLLKAMVSAFAETALPGEPRFPVKKAVMEFIRDTGFEYIIHPECWGLAVIRVA